MRGSPRRRLRRQTRQEVSARTAPFESARTPVTVRRPQRSKWWPGRTKRLIWERARRALTPANRRDRVSDLGASAAQRQQQLSAHNGGDARLAVARRRSRSETKYWARYRGGDAACCGKTSVSGAAVLRDVTSAAPERCGPSPGSPARASML